MLTFACNDVYAQFFGGGAVFSAVIAWGEAPDIKTALDHQCGAA
jgi:hypothetical protein